MKKILIADDDSAARGMLSRLLQSSSNKLEVITAKSAEEALRLLNQQKIDLFVTDLHISGNDGLKFLNLIRRNHNDLIVFVMTAFGTPEIKNTVEKIEKSGYFEKPLNIKTLTESIIKELEPPIEDQSDKISLPSFLRRIAKEIKTCTLVIKSGSKQGELFFLNGDLISAKTDDLENKDAAYEIISWKKSNVEIHNAVPQVIRRIDEPLVDVLMEGLRRREKKERSLDRKQEGFREPEASGSDKAGASPEKPDTPEENENESYSEHYSLTKDFIKKIDEIQMSALTEATEQNETDRMMEARPGQTTPLSVSPLSRILRKIPGIMEYGIFDKKDTLYTGFLKSEVMKSIRPAAFRESVQFIEHPLGAGHFQYMIIRQKENRYIVFCYGSIWIVMAVNPDFKITRFMK